MQQNPLAHTLKVFFAIAFIFIANQTLARPTTDHMTICYGVDKKDNMSFKTPCMVSSAGGAGVHVVTYQIKGKEYHIEQSDYTDSLNGQPYKTYVRGAFFERMPDTTEEGDYSFFCYKSRQAHFCSKQDN